MKSTYSLLHWRLLLVVALVLAGVTIGGAPVLAATGTVTSTALPSDGTVNIGEPVVVSINIDMTGVAPPDDKLGSFTASLDWDPAILTYGSNGGLQAGFTGVVNTANIATGHITVNGANPTGTAGSFTVVQITFNAVGAGTSTLNLGYSAMAAAGTFANLLPNLTVHDGQVLVNGPEFTLTVAASPSGGGTTNPTVGTHSYSAGTPVNVTATAAAGYEFDHWSGDCTGTGACSVTMNADKSVTANFAVMSPDLTVAVSPSGGGTTNPAVGVHSYAYGAVVNVTATAAVGYEFDHWSGACTGSGACSVTMNADKSVTAVFNVISHDLTVAVSPSGAGTTNPGVGVHPYAYGTVVNVTATAAAGYEFDHWSGACTGSGACSVTMNADKAVTANFALITHDLTVAVSPSGTGTTNPAVGVHGYAPGTVVNVTAAAAVGYEFDHWSGACTGSGACSVTMDADKAVTAVFNVISHDLTVAVSPGGTGTTNPAVGVHPYAYGTVINVTATAAAGYEFDHWSGACTGSGTCSVTMNADKSVTANFAVMSPDLTVAVSPSGGGTTNPAVGVHSYAYGAVVNITATAAAGYEFDHWSGACTGTGTCQVTMNADKAVTANFARIYTLTVAVTPSGGGTTNPAVGVYTHPSGTVVNVTATAAPGYQFDHWSGACSGTGTCSVTMNADKTVTARFVRTYTLTVAVSPSGGGTTNPAVGVYAYPSGTVVNVTATAAAGYEFDHWSGDCTGSGACSVTMDANKSVTAHFEGVAYELTIAVDPPAGGTTVPAAGVHSYAAGQVVTITATAAAGYGFDHWSGDCTGTGTCQVTMNDHKTVTAHLTVEDQHLTVAVSPTGGGTTNPEVGVHAYAYGTQVNVTATPTAGYEFDQWSGDCTGTGACSVTMDADKSVTAHFKVESRACYLPLISVGR